LEVGAPEILQTYSVEDEQAIKAALTDSELFDSYNAPAKGLAPLEKVLASAPQDVRVNQRLASLYARLHRFAEAAQCCQVLQEVYERAGHIEQAAQYRDMATRYRDRAAAAPPVPAPAPPAADSSQPSPAAPDAGGDVFPAGSLKAEGPPETPAAAPASEIDLSEEWESSAVESPAVAETRGPELQPAETEELLNEVRFYLSQDMWEEAQAVVSRLAIIAPDTAELPHLRQRLAEMRAAAPAEETEVPSPAAVAEPAPSPASEFVFGGSAPTPETAAPRPPQPVPPARTQPGVLQPAASAAGTDTLGDFVLDLEEALGNDFQLADQTAAARKSSAPVPPVAVTPAPAPSPAAPVPAPVVAARDSSSSLQPVQEEAASPLADMFAEFKEEAEQEVEPEDPETHYNLGVAFKEMGLLDEAIGELQKVCQAVDHGLPFSQVMQAYTWLANCFVEKGVPEAGIKWYERALKLSPDEDSRMAVHYDLASAYEAAGNKQAALQHFLEVYGSNIDYRDVADRIQALRS